MLKKIFASVLILIIAAVFTAGALAENDHREISSKLLRLHVIANSDSEEDQALKLKVRDSVFEYVTLLTKDANTLKEAKEAVKANLEDIRTIAENTAAENGSDCKVTAEVSNVFFPTKEYESFSLPAGDYEALRIIIGNGEGRNWWCVLFPPLCVAPDASHLLSAAEDAGLSDDEISLITENGSSYKIRFFAVDLYEKLLQKLKA